MKKIIALLAFILPLFANAQYIHFAGDTAANAPYIKYFHSNYVLVGLGFGGGTFTYDCTDPNNIVIVSGVSVTGGTDYIQIEDSIVYSGSWMSHSVSIADFSNIYGPLVIGNLTGLNGNPHGIAVNGDYFYLALGNDSLYVVDQSDLNAPFITNTIFTGDYMRELAIHNDIVYAATMGGIKVIDVSDPVNPAVIASIGSDYYEVTVDTENARLFASKGNSIGFDVFDISLPSAIDILFSGGVGYTGKGVAYYDNKILQGTENGAINVVAVYDVSAAPVVLLDTYLMNSGFTGITLKDSTFYTGDYVNFSIFNLSANDEPAPGPNPGNDTLTLTVYPNPFTGELNINGLTVIPEQNCKVVILDALGTIIHTEEISDFNETINLHELSPGTYFWNVFIDNISYDQGTLTKAGE